MSGAQGYFDDGGAIQDDDYSKFNYQTQEQNLPTGNPGGPDVQVQGGNVGSWDALRNSQQTFPSGNPDMNEGQLPVANRGNVPVPQGGTGAIPSLPGQQHTRAMQAIIGYLHGDGAADPATVKQVEQSVDPQGSMDPNQRTVATIKAAADQGGPDAGFSFIQANRQQYNAKQSFARAALNGVQGKPPDLNAAVNAANQAYYHVPDGQGVQFTNNGQGVTATVNGQNFQLSPQQFDQWLDVGGKGQFDNVYENGAAKVLSSISQPQQQNAGDNGDDEAGAIPEQQSDPNDIRPFAAPNVAAQDPRKYRARPAGYQPPPPPDTAGYEPDLQERANRMFPWASQGHQKEAWLAQQQGTRDTAETANQQAIELEKNKGETQKAIWGERGKTAENVAQTRAGAYVTGQQLKADAAKGAFMQRASALAQSSRDRNLATAARMINAKVMANQTLTPQEQSTVDTIYKTSSGGPGPAAPAQQAQPQSNTRVVGNTTYEKRSDGKWYPIAGQ